MSNQIELSIVIPCYRDADHIEGLLSQIGADFDARDYACELVLVDDGSPDGTGDRIAALASSFPHRLTFVRLARNFGQHPAVFAGLEASRGNVVVTMDSDLQYPLSCVDTLLEALDQDHQVASGFRAERKDPLGRRVITRTMTRWLNQRTGQQLLDYGSMFRAYDREVVDAMVSLTERHRFIPAIPSWLGFKVAEVAIEHQSRGEQGSRYRLSSLVQLFLDLLTSYSVAPLRAVSLVASVGALCGFAASIVFILYRIAVGDGIAGVVSAFALVFGLLAAQLAILAMLSEYVGRIYVETREHPYYLVRQTTRFDEAA